jgi:hypothetical protein
MRPNAFTFDVGDNALISTIKMSKVLDLTMGVGGEEWGGGGVGRREEEEEVREVRIKAMRTQVYLKAVAEDHFIIIVRITMMIR